MFKNVLITGGTGMVGTAFRELLPDAVYLSSKDFDLRRPEEALRAFRIHRPQYVIHLAAKVGGIKANTDKMADFYLDNVRINTNTLEAARAFGVKKVVSLLSTCVYPDNVTYPLTEDQVQNGEPHESNFAYAYAKRMLDVQSRAYRQQYKCNFVTAIPNNLFGEADNYHLENSHVIPAIMRKMYEANQKGHDVDLWGDGTPLREFTYAKDLVRALLILLEGYDEPEPINVGNTQEISIKDIAEAIAERVGFKGSINWQTNMPAGQHRKPSSTEKFQFLFNIKYTPFDEALTKVCQWFIMNYPNVRGVK